MSSVTIGLPCSRRSRLIYLANSNSLQTTAKQLSLHVNTVAYRIKRIQDITSLDLSKTEDCLQARVALMILEDEAV